MTLAHLIVKVSAETADFIREMEKAAHRTERMGRQMENAGHRWAEAVTLPLVAAAAVLTHLAAELDQTERQFAVTFGNLSGEAQAFSESLANKLQLSGNDIQKLMSQFQLLFENMKVGPRNALALTEAMTKLTEDLSAFSGLPVDDVFTKLQKGMAGAGRGLKTLGIVIDDQMVKQYALNHGIMQQGQQLDDGAAALVRFTLIQQQAAKAQDFFARNTDSPAIKLRQLKEQLKESGEQMARAFLPFIIKGLGALIQLTQWLKSVADGFAHLSPRMKTFIVATLGIVAAFGPALMVVGRFVRLLGSLPGMFTAVLNPIGLFVLAMGAATAAGIAIVNNWDFLKMQARLLWTTIVDKVESAVIRLLKIQAGWNRLLGKQAEAAAYEEMAHRIEMANEHMLANTAVALNQQEQELIDYAKRLGTMNAPTVGVGIAAAPIDADAAARALQNSSTTVTATQKIAEAFATLDEQMRQALVMWTLTHDNMALATDRATAYEAAIRAIVATGANANTVLAASGFTVAGLAKQWGEFQKALIQVPAVMKDAMGKISTEHKFAADMAQHTVDMTQAVQSSLMSSFETLGEGLGMIFRNMHKAFKNFGATLKGILGNMLVTVGKSLIAFGVAGLAIKRFIKSPATAIAAGIALVALGSALAASAQGSLNAGGESAAGGGGGTGAVASAAGPSGGERTTIVYVQLLTQTGEEVSRQMVYDERRFRNLGGRVPGEVTAQLAGVRAIQRRP